jgi:hypothetical protein
MQLGANVTWHSTFSNRKVTNVKVKFTVEKATKAQRGSRDTALIFL